MSKRSYQQLPPNILPVQIGNKTRLTSKNLAPSIQVYGERLITISDMEYRLWLPQRSKLSAMIEKDMLIPIKKNSKILYLGAASGTTASHISDIIEEGRLFAVDISPRAMQQLINLSKMRNNMVPILADATRPISYKAVVESVDIIYQDVAHPDQAKIALANAKEFLKDDGFLIMQIKARSIDSTLSPSQVYKMQLKKLEDEFTILGKQILKPFHKDHLALIAKWRNSH